MPSGTSVDKSAGAWCTTWGESYYADVNDPNHECVLYYDWQLSASGTVTVSGGVTDDHLGPGGTADSDADAYAGVDTSGADGDGYASGYVSEYSTGTASYSPGGYATEDYGTKTESAGYYYATLSFSVDGGDTDVPYQGSQFTAGAEVEASASCSAAVSASPGYGGSADASASANCNGSSSVSVQ